MRRVRIPIDRSGVDLKSEVRFTFPQGRNFPTSSRNLADLLPMPRRAMQVPEACGARCRSASTVDEILGARPAVWYIRGQVSGKATR